MTTIYHERSIDHYEWYLQRYSVWPNPSNAKLFSSHIMSYTVENDVLSRVSIFMCKIQSKLELRLKLRFQTYIVGYGLYQECAFSLK